MKLCLDSLTLTDTEPVELIHAASEAGFDLVSLWVQAPALYPSALLSPEKAQASLAALSQTGMRVGPLEVFNLLSAEAVESYRPALELGARLGAKTASAINTSNTDATQVSELFARFAELAAACDLGVTIEPLTKFATATLAQATDMIRSARVDAGIVFDVYHLVREGGSVADVYATGPGLIRYVQLCDGPASVPPDAAPLESWQERLYPGDGIFPLIDVFSAVPTNIAWGVEAPSRRRANSGMSAAQQAKEVMGAVRKVISRIPKAQKSLGH